MGSNCYLDRYASNWTNFQLKWSILDPNRGIFGNWPMGYWGGGPLSYCLQTAAAKENNNFQTAPLKKICCKPPNCSREKQQQLITNNWGKQLPISNFVSTNNHQQIQLDIFGQWCIMLEI